MSLVDHHSSQSPDELREDVDLIMLATHGRGGRDRLMFGSVADTVVRNSHRPIFMVPVR